MFFRINACIENLFINFLDTISLATLGANIEIGHRFISTTGLKLKEVVLGALAALTGLPFDSG